MSALIIIAGSFKQAQYFAREQGLNVDQWNYISKPWDLGAVVGRLYCLVGGWEHKPLINEIMREVELRGLKRIKVDEQVKTSAISAKAKKKANQ